MSSEKRIDAVRNLARQSGKSPSEVAAAMAVVWNLSPFHAAQIAHLASSPVPSEVPASTRTAAQAAVTRLRAEGDARAIALAREHAAAKAANNLVHAGALMNAHSHEIFRGRTLDAVASNPDDDGPLAA